jgi:hypothetical protein
MAGVVYLTRSLPSEKAFRAAWRSYNRVSYVDQMRDIAYLELCVIVLALDQVHYPRQPALFFNRFFCLLRPPLDRAARVTRRLLDAFPNKDLENFQRAL